MTGSEVWEREGGGIRKGPRAGIRTRVARSATEHIFAFKKNKWDQTVERKIRKVYTQTVYYSGTKILLNVALYEVILYYFFHT